MSPKGAQGSLEQMDGVRESLAPLQSLEGGSHLSGALRVFSGQLCPQPDLQPLDSHPTGAPRQGAWATHHT